MNLNELADALDELDPSAGYGNAAYDKDCAVLKEASALIRAAAGADVDDLIGLSLEYGIAAARGRGDDIIRTQSALETRLRLLVAQLPRWRPISEAPKDGTRILIGYLPEVAGHTQEVVWWSSTRGVWCGRIPLASTGIFAPTHFHHSNQPPRSRHEHTAQSRSGSA